MKTRLPLVIILLASIIVTVILEPVNSTAQGPVRYKIIEGLQIVTDKLAANDLYSLGSTVFEFALSPFYGASLNPGDKDGCTTIYVSPISPISPVSPPLIAKFIYTQQTFPATQVFSTTNGPKQSIDRFFRLQATVNNAPISTTIFYSPIGVVVVRYTQQDVAQFESPLKLYRLKGSTWITTGIKTIAQRNNTLTSTVSNFFTDTFYAVLGARKNSNLYLPIVLK